MANRVHVHIHTADKTRRTKDKHEDWRPKYSVGQVLQWDSGPYHGTVKVRVKAINRLNSEPGYDIVMVDDKTESYFSTEARLKP